MRDTNPLAPAHTAVAPFTIQRTLKLLLLPGEPWRLPVARLEEGKHLDACAQRALVEATGVGDVFLEQLYTFAASDRAPGVVVSYCGLIPYDRVQIRAGGGEWVDPTHSPPTAPGLRQIIGRRPLEKRNFRQRIRASQHLLETHDTRRDGRHRPARLYRLRDTEPSVRG